MNAPRPNESPPNKLNRSPRRNANAAGHVVLWPQQLRQLGNIRCLCAGPHRASVAALTFAAPTRPRNKRACPLASRIENDSPRAVPLQTRAAGNDGWASIRRANGGRQAGPSRCGLQGYFRFRISCNATALQNLLWALLAVCQNRPNLYCSKGFCGGNAGIAHAQQVRLPSRPILFGLARHGRRVLGQTGQAGLKSELGLIAADPAPELTRY